MADSIVNIPEKEHLRRRQPQEPLYARGELPNT